MNGPGDVVHVLVEVLCAAAIIGILAVALLRALRRASLLLQVVAVAVASLGALVGGMVITCQQMYISAADFRVFLSVAAIAGVISVGLAVFLGVSLLRNSRDLIEKARRIGDPLDPNALGDEPLRHASNEFAVLGRELAASDERLRRSRERESRTEASRRELVAWISHDLRTPLAGLRAMAEALEDGVADDPQRYHRQMLAQVDRLGGMVDDLFQLSTIHAGALRLRLQTLSVRELVADLVAQLEPVASARGVRLVGRDVADITLVADPDELARAIANLAMNSIRLSPPGAEIVLSAAPDSDAFVVLSVTDAAGGIREADLGRVFEPGWRATESRTPAEGPAASGAGFGLAIVKGIVAAHAGRVAVQNVGDGCRFDVFVPRAARAA
ncbi:sensor histidine kinase [Frondihabitans australicus]|uniref:Sensor-like histidine kinase SenX3 n=1 Tax=Frondihabitans australicus TaxID=386892 RepID=A0A495II21_9MICO|nr:HAMP domain-containing sensor histidine kinase [Frondihabitans australicus]RKR75068.1 signal transduction histidine kinase [Frondihabitans australicus]